MANRRRLVVVGVLLVLTAGVCVQYAQAELWTYPNSDGILNVPEVHDNTAIFEFAVVQEVDSASEEIIVNIAPHRVDVRAIDPAVVDRLEPGSEIQIYGTLREESQLVVADTLVVDVQGTADRLYVYGTSLLGALIAAAGVLKHWRFDWRRLRFEPRGDR